MLPTPEMSVWSSSARLRPVRRRRSASTNASVVERLVQRVEGDVGDLGRQLGAVIGDRQPAEHPLVDEPDVVPPLSSITTRRCLSGTAPRGRTSSWPLIPRCPRTASPESSGSHRYLPRRRAAVDLLAGELLLEVGDAGDVSSDRARVQHADAFDGVTDHMRRRDRDGRPRPREAQAPAAAWRRARLVGEGVATTGRHRPGRRRTRRARQRLPRAGRGCGRPRRGALRECCARRSRRPAARLPSWNGPCRGRRPTHRPAPAPRTSSRGQDRCRR